MKKNITIACLVGSAYLISSTFGVFNSLLLFLLVGKVPGTQYSFSPIQMGFIVTLAATLATAFIMQPYYRAFLKSRADTIKARLPKRRYNQV